MKRSMKYLIIAAALNILPATGWAQGKITLSSSVDKATITIGDLITYTVTVSRDEDVEVRLPALGENLGGFEIRDYQVYDPQKKAGRILDKVDYIISTFDVGEFEIPPVAIGYFIPPDSTEIVLKTESIKITVESVKPSEEGDIQDIKFPWEIPFNWKPVIIWGMIGFVVILLIVILVIHLRKRKRGESILPRKIEIPRPPHEVAYEELQKLAESDWLEQGQFKIYYSEVSEIIRRYIEGRFDVIALELTSTEVLEQLSSDSLPDEHFSLFEKFLDCCDLVKFAKYIPVEKENEEILQIAFEIVDRTKWVEPETPEAEMENLERDSEVQKDVETSASSEVDEVDVDSPAASNTNGGSNHKESIT